MSKERNKRQLTDGELEQVASHFRLLGEPMRLKILQSLCKGPRTVGEIVEATGATQANISKHLSLLAAAGILTRQKDRQCVYYGLKDELTLKMCDLVHNHLGE
jgi:DNA-binding transcriptional ArsR family regulator